MSKSIALRSLRSLRAILLDILTTYPDFDRPWWNAGSDNKAHWDMMKVNYEH